MRFTLPFSKITILSEREADLWRDIKRCAEAGYESWRAYMSKPENAGHLCPPWTTDMDNEHCIFLSDLYSKIKPGEYIVDSLGWTQCMYYEYEHIRNYIILW